VTARPLLALFLALATQVAAGEPWLDPGDSGLRSDLQMLADAGVIGGPLSAWPLSWGDIAGQLNDPGDLSEAESAALARISARARAERSSGHWHLLTEASAGSDPRLIRDFEDLPREQAEIAAGLQWTGNRAAVKLVAQYVADPEDDQELRADGSYAGLALGNWMIAAAATDRWWGPGWQGSLILSNNARPIPAFTIDRNSTAPFETKWLHWIGHWDFVTLFGFLEHDRDFPNARFFGMRLTDRPTRWLELGVSRTAIWCGDGRPCGFDTFLDLLQGNDSAGNTVSPEDEPGDQLAGYDVRLSGSSLGVPIAAYVQRIGEDFYKRRPSLFLTQAGLETWGGLGALGTYRVYLEVSDTLCGANIYGEGKADCAYEHHIYTDGVRYRGRSIGHSFDNDSEVWTLGALLNDGHEGSWMLSLAAGDLNREGAPSSTNTVAAVKTAYRSVSFVHRRSMPIGEIQAMVGMESFEDAATGDDDQDWLISLNWHRSW
jgi:hypothetical protein